MNPIYLYHKVKSKLDRLYVPIRNFVATAIIYGVLFFAVPRFLPNLPWNPISPGPIITAFSIYFILSIWEYIKLFKEWKYYEARLGDVSKEADGDYYYQDLKFIYFVGKSGRKDFWLRKYVLVAEGEVIRIKDMMFGVGGDESKMLPFSALKVKAFSSGNSSRKVRIIPFAEGKREARHWEGAAYFDPELSAGDTYSFGIRGRWIGLWDKLRLDKKDSCSVEITKPAINFEIAITLHEKIEADFFGTQSFPKEATLLEKNIKRDGKGRKQIFLLFENAPPGKYVFQIKTK